MHRNAAIHDRSGAKPRLDLVSRLMEPVRLVPLGVPPHVRARSINDADFPHLRTGYGTRPCRPKGVDIHGKDRRRATVRAPEHLCGRLAEVVATDGRAVDTHWARTTSRH